jgi:hypothetical protein
MGLHSSPFVVYHIEGSIVDVWARNSQDNSPHPESPSDQVNRGHVAREGTFTVRPEGRSTPA